MEVSINHTLVHHLGLTISHKSRKCKSCRRLYNHFKNQWAKLDIFAMTDLQFGILKPLEWPKNVAKTLFTTLNRFASILENSLKHSKLNERHPKLFSHTYLKNIIKTHKLLLVWL